MNMNPSDQPSNANEEHIDGVSSMTIEKRNDQAELKTETEDNNPLLTEINRLTQLSYELKKEGDEELKMKKYEEAYTNYTKAVITVKELFKQNKQSQDELTKIVKEVLVASNSNMCFIDIKKQDWANCLRHANKVLHYDQSNVKGRYRRCLAYINLGKNEKADEDLFELEDLIGGTKELEELEALFDSKKVKEKNEEGMIYKRMSKKLRNPEIMSKREIIQQKQQLQKRRNSGIVSSIQSIYTSCLRYFCSICRKKKKSKEY